MRFEEWKFSFAVAWDDTWCRWQSIGTVIFTCTAIVILLQKMIVVGMQNSLLIFHYNMYLGIDEVQHWSMAFLYAGLLLAVVCIDLLWSFFLFRRDRIASRMLLFAATIFAIIFLLGASAIVSVNV
jgi:hypothetical protein